MRLTDWMTETSIRARWSKRREEPVREVPMVLPEPYFSLSELPDIQWFSLEL